MQINGWGWNFLGGKEWKRRGSSEHQYLRGDWNKNNRAGREAKEIEQNKQNNRINRIE